MNPSDPRPLPMATRATIRRLAFIAVVAALPAGAWQPAAAEPAIDNGQFRLVLDEQNAALPASLMWRGKNLLDADRGLGWSFTSFEFRNKFYRDENAHVWAGKDEPRFVTDVGPVTTGVVRTDGWTTARATPPTTCRGRRRTGRSTGNSAARRSRISKPNWWGKRCKPCLC